MIKELVIVTVIATTVRTMKGGQPASPDEFKFAVSIWINSELKLCGGVLVTESDVVTTCSCVAKRHSHRTNLVKYDLRTIELYVGSVEPFEESKGQMRPPTKSDYHPGCILKTLNQANFDLGVYRALNKFLVGSSVQPYILKYDEREDLDQEILNMITNEVKCTALGWSFDISSDEINRSLNDHHRPKGQRLKKLSVRLVDEETCRNVLCTGKTSTCDIDIYTRGDVCAQHDEGTGPCKSDSGHGLVCEGKIVGVTSLSRPCARLQVMGTYMRMDVAYRFLSVFITGKEVAGARKIDSKARLGISISFLLILLNYQ